MENILALQALDAQSDSLYVIHDWSTVSIDCCDGTSYAELLQTVGN